MKIVELPSKQGGIIRYAVHTCTVCGKRWNSPLHSLAIQFNCCGVEYSLFTETAVATQLTIEQRIKEHKEIERMDMRDYLIALSASWDDVIRKLFYANEGDFVGHLYNAVRRKFPSVKPKDVSDFVRNKFNSDEKLRKQPEQREKERIEQELIEQERLKKEREQHEKQEQCKREEQRKHKQIEFWKKNYTAIRKNILERHEVYLYEKSDIAKPELATQSKHDFTVTSIAVSPDSSLALTGSEDLSVRLWEICTGKEWLKLEGHTERIKSVAFSPCGNFFVTGSVDKTARIWDIRTAETVTVLEGHQLVVEAAVFSPQCRQVLTGSWDCNAKLWDVESGDEILSFDKHTEYIWSVGFSSDGNYVVTGGQDRIINVWNVRDGSLRSSITTSPHTIQAVQFFTDNNVVIAAHDDGVARVWDIHSRKVVRKFREHTDFLWSVVAYPEMDLMVTCGKDNKAKIWDISKGKVLKTFNHQSSILSAIISPDGRFLITCDDNGRIGFWVLPVTYAQRRQPQIEQVQIKPGDIIVIEKPDNNKTKKPIEKPAFSFEDDFVTNFDDDLLTKIDEEVHAETFDPAVSIEGGATVGIAEASEFIEPSIVEPDNDRFVVPEKPISNLFDVFRMLIRTAIEKRKQSRLSEERKRLLREQSEQKQKEQEQVASNSNSEPADDPFAVSMKSIYKLFDTLRKINSFGIATPVKTKSNDKDMSDGKSKKSLEREILEWVLALGIAGLILAMMGIIMAVLSMK